MEIEDFETIHLARELARDKGWEHVLRTIRAALAAEAAAGADGFALDRRAAAGAETRVRH